MTLEMRDAELVETVALPDGANKSVVSDPIDLGTTSRGDHVALCEFVVSAPALTTTMLPNSKTMTYLLEHDDDPAFGGAETLADNLIVQTGAGSAGAAAATKRFRAPINCKRYVRLKVTSGADVTDSSTKTAELALVF